MGDVLYPPSRSGYALRLGARIRPTALRSSLALRFAVAETLIRQQ